MFFKMAVIFINRVWQWDQMKNHFPIQDIGKYYFFKTICSSRIVYQKAIEIQTAAY